MLFQAQKRIAILIPTYNSSKTIEATLRSLQEQGDSLNYIQTIYIADDHSKDKTPELVEEIWSEKIPLSIFRSENNFGERGNVNRALEIIQDSVDWVLLLHSDDIAKPNWLEMMIGRIEHCSEEVGSICSSWDNLMPDGSVIPGEDDLGRQVEVIAGNAGSIKHTLLKGCWWHISGCAIRMKAFKDIGNFDPVLPQMGDWDWMLRCLAHGWAIEYIPRTLILYRQHSASVSSESYKTHRDITESLKIARQYEYLLSNQEKLDFHLTKINYLIRRIGKSTLQFKLKRLSMAFIAIIDVLISLAKSSQTKETL